MKPMLLLLCGTLIITNSAIAGSKEEAVLKSIKDLASKDAATRKNAAEEIGKVGQIKSSAAKPAVKPLLELLADRDAGVRAAAATALARIDVPSETVPAFIKLLKSEKENAVRIAAIHGLGLMGDRAREAVPVLREIQRESRSDANRRVGRAAGEAVRQITGANRKKP